MNLMNLPKKTRQYLPQKFNAQSAKEVKEIVIFLTENPPQDFQEARVWYGTFHELSCAVSQIQTILELNLSLEQGNKVHEKKCEEFESKVLSLLLENREKMIDIYLQSPFKNSMHGFDSGRIENELRIRKKYSVSALSSLQLEENKIIRDYKKWTNQAKINFQGKQYSLAALFGLTHNPDASLRKQAFFAAWSWVKENEGTYQRLFDELFSVRQKQAQIVGCASYADLAFVELGRFDYTPQDCAQFCQSILQEVVPVLQELSSLQKSSLQEKSISPWNGGIWPEFQPKGAPFGGDSSRFFPTFEKVFEKIHPVCGNLFRLMQGKKLFELFPRQGKGAGAFSVTLAESGFPFLYGNFGLNTKDIFTFIHEFGHCVHSFAMGQIDNILVRQPGFEFCEFASISMELLASSYLSHIWVNPTDAQKALKAHLFQMLNFWPFMAMMDEWQHAVYAQQKCDAQFRNELWKSLSKKYFPHWDWSACPEFQELGWLSRHHIFTSPFYFIDYGIAQLGALQLWQQAQENRPQAVCHYLNSLALGGQLRGKDLFLQAGVQMDFSPILLRNICLYLKEQLSP